MGHSAEVVADFADHTTAHGFGNVLRCDSCSGKGVWIVAMLIAWTVCCIQLAVTIIAYLQYPTATTIAVQYSSSVQFPAVTVCNLNAARWSKMLNDSTLANYTNLLRAARPQTRSWNEYAPGTGRSSLFNQDSINEETAYKLLYIQAIYERNLPMSMMGHQLEDMLLDCTFQGRQCAPQNFTQWQHGSYGNCYTIIIAKDQYPSFIGPDYGLALTLFAEEYEYCPLISPAVGFRVAVHSPSYVPFPEDLGFTVSPGSMASVTMRQVIIARQPFPYDGQDCRNILQDGNTGNPNIFTSWSNKMLKEGRQAGTNYTNQACKKSCYLLHLAKQCGCVDAAYVTYDQMKFAHGQSQTPRACNYSNSTDIHCVRMATITINAECDKVCDQPCYEEDYDTRITNSLWPRPKYFSTMQNAWSQRNPRLKNMTMQEASSQILKLEIYFRVLNYEAITESPAISLADLLTDIGGILGLYGGFSFLTILEFFECCARLTSRRKQRSKQETVVEQMTASHNQRRHYIAK